MLVRARADMQKFMEADASHRFETVFLQQHKLAALASVFCVIPSEQSLAEKIASARHLMEFLLGVCSEVVECTDRVDCHGLDPGTSVSKGFMMTGLL